MRLYERDVPADVLTAVAGGEVVFASTAGAAVGRAAVTDATDGTRWVGLSAVRVAETQRRRGHARDLCAALAGVGRGPRGHLCVRPGARREQRGDHAVRVDGLRGAPPESLRRRS